MPCFHSSCLGIAAYEPAQTVPSTDLTPPFTHHIHSKVNYTANNVTIIQISICCHQFSLNLVLQRESPDEAAPTEHVSFFWLAPIYSPTEKHPNFIVGNYLSPTVCSFKGEQ